MLNNFLERLFVDGRLVLESESVPSPRGIQQAVSRLCELELDYRQQLATSPPNISESAAEWALQTFYEVSLKLAYPHLANQIMDTAKVAAPDPANPEAVYSVDLLFRFLPDLFRLAKAANANAVLEQLSVFANEWPLSSVGLEDVSPVALDGILSQPALRMLYVDRIIARQDASRIRDERVLELVQAAVGIHAEFAPFLSLTNTDQDSSL
ncbi:MAG: hypothetical protein KDA69_12830 [Planctomycetaceae bacterium]|nr:hypothetical protein [Planctomycetaceae bacterium]MCA9045203.1 hypothetical protein [Planctomycetaceae bacterium]